jgi:hypothetical protein
MNVVLLFCQLCLERKEITYYNYITGETWCQSCLKQYKISKSMEIIIDSILNHEK